MTDGPLTTSRMEFKMFLKHAIERAGKDAAEIARHFGVRVQSVYQWRSGATVPKIGRLQEVLDYLGYGDVRVTSKGAGDEKVYIVEGPDLDRLRSEIEGIPAPVARTISSRDTPEVRPAEVETVARTSLPRDIPVLGIAVGGEDADFSMNGTIIDYVRRPPGLISAAGIFAINVVSDSMAPRYEPGDMLYISETRTPVRGDYVVVELIPSEGGHQYPAFLKRLVSRTPTRIVCEQFNPAREVVFDVSRVRHVYRVFPLRELML